MTFARPDHTSDFDTLPRVPAWVTSARAESLEDVAFLFGAALAYLHLVLCSKDVPQTLLRNRLALSAADACVTYQGRPERVSELRDAVAFLQPGDSPGPAGEVYGSWRRAVERPISVKALHRALLGVEVEQIAIWLDAGQGAPVMCAALVLQAVQAERPRDHVTVLILADAAFAQTLDWAHVTDTLELALDASGCDSATVVQKPCLLSDNGSSYVAADLADYLDIKGMDHVRGTPHHPQTQGKIERWHQTMKNRVLLENYYLPGDLERQVSAFVDHYNYHQYHESLGNLTPADVYHGRSAKILTMREEIKKQTIRQRRLQHQSAAAKTQTEIKPEPPLRTNP